MTKSEAPQFIELPDVMRRTTLKKTAIYALVKKGELKSIKLGRKTVFDEADISAWMAKKISDAKAEQKAA